MDNILNEILANDIVKYIVQPYLGPTREECKHKMDNVIETLDTLFNDHYDFNCDCSKRILGKGTDCFNIQCRVCTEYICLDCLSQHGMDICTDMAIIRNKKRHHNRVINQLCRDFKEAKTNGYSKSLSKFAEDPSNSCKYDIDSQFVGEYGTGLFGDLMIADKHGLTPSDICDVEDSEQDSDEDDDESNDSDNDDDNNQFHTSVLFLS